MYRAAAKDCGIWNKKERIGGVERGVADAVGAADAADAQAALGAGGAARAMKMARRMKPYLNMGRSRGWEVTCWPRARCATVRQ